VHGQIGAAIGQGEFQFFHEQALATDFGERSIQDFVPARRHGEKFDAAIGIQPAQQVAHMLRLP
jgi:hypothetical protein